MKNKILIFLFSICFSMTGAQTNYFPDIAWQVKTPEEMKINKTLLDSARKFCFKP
ncbi:MAG: hypothetical protein ACI9OE_001541 [Mariniflexile sp.]|jgi:hypothetical protein